MTRSNSDDKHEGKPDDPNRTLGPTGDRTERGRKPTPRPPATMAPKIPVSEDELTSETQFFDSAQPTPIDLTLNQTIQPKSSSKDSNRGNRTPNRSTPRPNMRTPSSGGAFDPDMPLADDELVDQGPRTLERVRDELIGMGIVTPEQWEEAAWHASSEVGDPIRMVLAHLTRMPSSPERGDVDPILTMSQAERIYERPLQYGRFRVVKRLGKGGMGVTYLAQRIGRLRQTVVLKVLRLSERVTPGETLNRQIEQMISEASKQISAVEGDSRYFPHFIDFIPDDVEPAIVMEYVPGATLDEHVGKNGESKLSIEDAFELVIKIAQAFEIPHNLQPALCHLDIKPNNIMVRPNGDPVVLDFGIARFNYNQEQKNERPAGTTGFQTKYNDLLGPRVGTPPYMPIEQWNGKPEARSDVYALGSTFYYVLTGKLAFPGTTEAEFIYLHGHADRPRSTAVRPEIPPELDAVLVRMMAIQADDRYQTMTEVVQALVKARSAWRKRLASARSRKRAMVAATIVFALFATTAAVAVMNYSQIRNWLVERYGGPPPTLLATVTSLDAKLQEVTKDISGSADTSKPSLIAKRDHIVEEIDAATTDLFAELSRGNKLSPSPEWGDVSGIPKILVARWNAKSIEAENDPNQLREITEEIRKVHTDYLDTQLQSIKRFHRDYLVALRESGGELVAREKALEVLPAYAQSDSGIGQEIALIRLDQAESFRSQSKLELAWSILSRAELRDALPSDHRMLFDEATWNVRRDLGHEMVVGPNAVPLDAEKSSDAIDHLNFAVADWERFSDVSAQQSLAARGLAFLYLADAYDARKLENADVERLVKAGMTRSPNGQKSDFVFTIGVGEPAVGTAVTISISQPTSLLHFAALSDFLEAHRKGAADATIGTKPLSELTSQAIQLCLLDVVKPEIYLNEAVALVSLAKSLRIDTTSLDGRTTVRDALINRCIEESILPLERLVKSGEGPIRNNAQSLLESMDRDIGLLRELFPSDCKPAKLPAAFAALRTIFSLKLERSDPSGPNAHDRWEIVFEELFESLVSNGDNPFPLSNEWPTSISWDRHLLESASNSIDSEKLLDVGLDQESKETARKKLRVLLNRARDIEWPKDFEQSDALLKIATLDDSTRREELLWELYRSPTTTPNVQNLSCEYLKQYAQQAVANILTKTTLHEQDYAEAIERMLEWRRDAGDSSETSEFLTAVRLLLFYRVDAVLDDAQTVGDFSNCQGLLHQAAPDLIRIKDYANSPKEISQDEKQLLELSAYINLGLGDRGTATQQWSAAKSKQPAKRLTSTSPWLPESMLTESVTSRRAVFSSALDALLAANSERSIAAYRRAAESLAKIQNPSVGIEALQLDCISDALQLELRQFDAIENGLRTIFESHHVDLRPYLANTDPANFQKLLSTLPKQGDVRFAVSPGLALDSMDATIARGLTEIGDLKKSSVELASEFWSSTHPALSDFRDLYCACALMKAIRNVQSSVAAIVAKYSAVSLYVDKRCTTNSFGKPLYGFLRSDYSPAVREHFEHVNRWVHTLKNAPAVRDTQEFKRACVYGAVLAMDVPTTDEKRAQFIKDCRNLHSMAKGFEDFTIARIDMGKIGESPKMTSLRAAIALDIAWDELNLGS